MTTRHVLTALSQAFVAFTIEVDNAFEARMPHRTALVRRDPNARGPWLTSLTYYSNFLRHLPNAGLAARDLARASGEAGTSLKSRLGELHRWRYVTISPGDDPALRMVVPSEWGRLARETWAPIEAEVEDRWRGRFGDSAIDSLRSALTSKNGTASMPLGFPILAWERATAPASTAPRGGADGLADQGLSTLLARTLVAIAREFDLDSDLSLSMTAILLRVMDAPIPSRELPVRTGVSKEAIAIAVGRLKRAGLATEDGTPKVVRLTADGEHVRTVAIDRLDALHDRLDASELAAPAAAFAGAPLAAGLVPPRAGWRARPPYLAQTNRFLADPDESLPQFPMVSHRGGYPDGS